ncbi:MAG: nucleotidyltransferase domain-containing protein, partial [Planctomycetaceae bacterium]|nr:nucleotidyltransferase domain-containing protein [Planctomycetaceae bacterium]
RILNCVEAEQIFLFGSYAYGTPHKDSDYDFYVVLPDDSPLERREAINTIMLNISADYPPIDVLANYKEQFDDMSKLPTLMRTIINKGIKLYDRNGTH